MNHQRNNGGSPVCGAGIGGRLVRDRRKVDCPDCLALPVPVMGRPSRAGKASAPIALRISDDERARWTTEADREGVSLSEWVRLVCNRNARDRDVY